MYKPASMKKSEKKNRIPEIRIYAIALAIAVFLIALPAFLRTHGDDTPTHSTATPVGAKETHIAQPARAPKAAPAAATASAVVLSAVRRETAEALGLVMVIRP